MANRAQRRAEKKVKKMPALTLPRDNAYGFREGDIVTINSPATKDKDGKLIHYEVRLI